MHTNSTSRLGGALRTLALIPSLAAAFAIAAMLPVSAMNTPVTDPSPASAGAPSEISRPADIEAPATDGTENEAHATSEVKPQFEGGEAELMRWVGRHIVFPKDVKLDKKVRVLVQFVIKADGTVCDFNLMRKSDIEALNQAAIDAIKSTSGKWTPGKIDGKPVNVTYTLPITFSMTSGSDKTATDKK